MRGYFPPPCVGSALSVPEFHDVTLNVRKPRAS
jgi:hypothetical protein